MQKTLIGMTRRMKKWPLGSEIIVNSLQNRNKHSRKHGYIQPYCIKACFLFVSEIITESIQHEII
jgi:hypothetical protein